MTKSELSAHSVSSGVYQRKVLTLAMPAPAYGASGQPGSLVCCSSLWGEQTDQGFNSDLLAPVTRLQLGLGCGGSNQNTMHFGQFFIIDGQKYQFSKL